MDDRRMLGSRYRLESLLGVGGMSEVWRAHDAVLDRTVAVKLLSGRLAADEASRRRIRDEARAAASLSHPHIAHVHDYGASEGGEPYVVMELVDGQTLAARASAGPIPPRQVFRLGAEVAGALAAAHAVRLVHRDIKLANIMLTPAGAKVVDFGIAAAVRPAAALPVDVSGPADPVAPSQLLGTPAYLAPERVTGNSVEPASDVYSLGVVLYLLLCRRLPWVADTATQLLTAHVSTEPEPMPQLADVPGVVRDLVHACLAKDPAARPGAAHLSVVLAVAAGAVAPALPEGATTDGDVPTVLTLSGAAALAAVPRFAWPVGGAVGRAGVWRDGGAPDGAGLSAGTALSAGTGTAAGAEAAAGAGTTAGAEADGFCVDAFEVDTGAVRAGTDTDTADTSASGIGGAGIGGAVTGAGAAPSVGGPRDSTSGGTGTRWQRWAGRRYRVGLAIAVVLALVALGWSVLPAGDRSSAAQLPTVPGPAHGTAIPGTPTTVPTNGVDPTPTGGQRTANGDPANSGAGAGAGPAAGDPGATGTAAAGAPPVTTTTTPGTTSTTAKTAGSGTVFGSVGGTVTAICVSSGIAKLIAWSPAASYTVTTVTAGPASLTLVVFTKGLSVVQMTVTCPGTTPVEVTKLSL